MKQIYLCQNVNVLVFLDETRRTELKLFCKDHFVCKKLQFEHLFARRKKKSRLHPKMMAAFGIGCDGTQCLRDARIEANGESVVLPQDSVSATRADCNSPYTRYQKMARKGI